MVNFVLGCSNPFTNNWGRLKFAFTHALCYPESSEKPLDGSLKSADTFTLKASLFFLKFLFCGWSFNGGNNY